MNMERLRQRIIGSGASTLHFWLYFLAIVSAELLTVYLQPMVGVVCHGAILIALLARSAFVADSGQRNLTLALGLVPLIRILSLALPLVQLPQVYWYPLIYAPLLAATVVVMWIVGLKANDVGLVSRELPFQILIGITSGLAYGILEYMIKTRATGNRPHLTTVMAAGGNPVNYHRVC